MLVYYKSQNSGDYRISDIVIISSSQWEFKVNHNKTREEIIAESGTQQLSLLFTENLRLKKFTVKNMILTVTSSLNPF